MTTPVRPLRVDLVSAHASPLAAAGGEDAGGQPVHVAGLATELGRMGCRVTVLTRSDSPHLPARAELAPGVVVEHVAAGPAEPVPRDETFRHMPAFAAHLARRWRTDPPDVVHTHHWMSGWAGLQAAEDRDRDLVPIVHTYHALGVVKARHQGAADTSPPERRPVEAEILAGVDHVIATSHDEVRELDRIGDTGCVTVVPSGIDPTVFRPDGPRLPLSSRPFRRPSRYRIVVVGRLVARKGVDDVIRALGQLPEAELVVAGGPPTGSLDADPEARCLRAVAQSGGVADRVTFLGGLPRRMVPQLLRTADVVVSAPRYEPFGIVPLEAMACGVPVVGTAVGGLLDTVQPGRTGLLVPPGDPDALAASVGRLLVNPSLRYRMGEEGAALVREHFTWAQVARSTYDVYQRVARPADWWSVSTVAAAPG